MIGVANFHGIGIIRGMFTYIDPTVRERLLEQGTLFQIDRDGHRLEPGQPLPPGSHSISVLGPIPLPLRLCETNFDVQWYACVRNTELGKIEELADDLREQNGQRSFATIASYMAVNSVMLIGDPQRWTKPLVRVHSSCLTGDVFGSERCECGPQMHAALERISTDDEGGMLVYMAGHEGRGIGLWAKAATYLLQDAGENTYEANESLGLPADSRDFSDAAALLKFFAAGRPIRLLTNNPKKVNDLRSFGIEDIKRVKHVTGVTESNRRYLSAKRERGHALTDQDIGGD